MCVRASAAVSSHFGYITHPTYHSFILLPRAYKVYWNEHGGNLRAQHVRLPIPNQRSAVLLLRAVAETERGEALAPLSTFRRDVVRKTAKK